MPISVKCECGKAFAAPDKYAGKKVKCPKCASPLVIPVAKQAKPTSGGSARTESGTAKVSVKCKCGKEISAKAELAGKTVRCPSCKEPMKIPAPKSASTAKSGTKVTAPSNDDLFDEVGIGFRGGGGSRCPECKRSMREEAIVCLECGYNRNLGRRMEVQRPITKADRAKKASAKANAPAKSKKKKWFF